MRSVVGFGVEYGIFNLCVEKVSRNSVFVIKVSLLTTCHTRILLKSRLIQNVSDCLQNKKKFPTDCKILEFHLPSLNTNEMAHSHFIFPLARENTVGLSSQMSIPVNACNGVQVMQQSVYRFALENKLQAGSKTEDSERTQAVTLKAAQMAINRPRKIMGTKGTHTRNMVR